jgi:hypothetical protein
MRIRSLEKPLPRLQEGILFPRIRRVMDAEFKGYSVKIPLTPFTFHFETKNKR